MLMRRNLLAPEYPPQVSAATCHSSLLFGAQTVNIRLRYSSNQPDILAISASPQAPTLLQVVAAAIHSWLGSHYKTAVARLDEPRALTFELSND